VTSIVEQSAEPHAQQPGRPDVFVSYSRRDEVFVRRLVRALEAHGKDVWVDWADIRKGADWLETVHGGIESAKVVVAVLSPDFATSDVCAEEVAYAIGHNKRLVPVLLRAVEQSAIRDELETPNWIFFDDAEDASFATAVEQLVEAVDTDLAWLDRHARLLVRALEWERESRDASFLLRGRDLSEAEGWLAEQGSHREAATSLQAEFIVASRKAAARRRHTLFAGVLVALGVSLVLGALAWIQRNDAIAQSKISRSRELAARATVQLPVDPAESLKLAVEAMHAKSTIEAEDALRQSFLVSHARHVLAGPGYVNVVAFSPDGKLVVTAPGSADRPPRVWDVATGKEVSVLRGVQVAGAIAFSPDSELVVTAGQDLRVWEPRTGKRIALLAPLGSSTDEFHRVFFSSNGKLLASGTEGGRVYLWDTANWGRLKVLSGSPMTFSPDGTGMLTIEGRRAFIRETSGWRRRERLAGRAVACGAYSPDGRFVVTVSPERVQVLSTESWRVIKSLREGGSQGDGCPVFFSHDGRLLSTGSRAWRTSTWKRIAWDLRSDWVHDLSLDLPQPLSPDWRLVVTPRADGTAQLRDTVTGETVAVLRGHTGVINSAAFSPDGAQIVTGSADGTARLWATPHNVVAILKGHRGDVESVAFTPNGKRVITAGTDGTVREWRVRTGEQVAVPIKIPDPCRARPPRLFHGLRPTLGPVALSPDGKLLLVGTPIASVDVDSDGGCSTSVAKGSGYTQVWQRGTWRRVTVLRGSEYAVSPSGKFVATITAAGRIRVHDIRTWETIAAEGGTRRDYFRSADFSPRGDLVVSTGRTVQVWHTTSRERVAVLGRNTDYVATAEFSPDGTLIVTTGYDGTARIWRATDGKRITVLRHGTADLQAAFSPDGKFLATSTDRTRLWDVSSWKEVANVVGQFMSFSADARFIVTATNDRGVRVWNPSGERVMAIFKDESASGIFADLGAAAFSPNGRLLVTAITDETARVFACEVCRPIGELLQVAEGRVTGVAGK
jgi:WD40 repeat protein